MITKLPFSLKYETGLDYPITMYDHLPYQRDSDYCNAEKIGLSTGKIIKYYLCNNETEPLTINNHDDEIDELLLHIQLQSRSTLRSQRNRSRKLNKFLMRSRRIKLNHC